MTRLAIYKGHQLTVDNFSEIDETDVVNIDGVDYVFYDWKYVDIVEFVIKKLVIHTTTTGGMTWT